MRRIFNYLAILLLLSVNFGCANKRYPDNMTTKERKEYYREFNESKTEAEWEQIRSERKSKKAKVLNTEGKENNNPNDTVKSISFSIENNSLFPKKLKINDSILDFKPLGKRYVGFKPNTKVYLLKNKTEKYLFTIKESDEGKEFSITN